MGEGNLPLKNTVPYAESIEIPYNYITAQTISDEIFPKDKICNNPLSIINRAILCPTNRESISINTQILNRIPGEKRVYYSVDSIEDDLNAEESENYTQVLKQPHSIRYAHS